MHDIPTSEAVMFNTACCLRPRYAVRPASTAMDNVAVPILSIPGPTTVQESGAINKLWIVFSPSNVIRICLRQISILPDTVTLSKVNVCVSASYEAFPEMFSPLILSLVSNMATPPMNISGSVSFCPLATPLHNSSRAKSAVEKIAFFIMRYVFIEI